MMNLRKYCVGVYEPYANTRKLVYKETKTAFSEEEAIRAVAAQKRFDGGPQGRDNYNPKFPITFEAHEIKDE